MIYPETERINDNTQIFPSLKILRSYRSVKWSPSLFSQKESKRKPMSIAYSIFKFAWVRKAYGRCAQLILRYIIHFCLLKHAITESAKWIKQTQIKALFSVKLASNIGRNIGVLFLPCLTLAKVKTKKGIKQFAIYSYFERGRRKNVHASIPKGMGYDQ